MYQDLYGLRELPFDLTPDPNYLYLTPSHQEALSNLEYGLSSAKSVTVVIGEAGTGKTTLLRAAVRSPSCAHVKCVHVNNPTLTRSEFIQMLANSFELSADAAQSKATLLRELETLLRERRARGEITALIVDEAQSLSGELLEEIRLLANIESTTEKLLPVVLAGQQELGTRLDQPELRQLKQRVALRCHIAPFEILDTAKYIVSRFRMAGGDATRVFTQEAVTLIHECSRGIPRTINVICDNSLVHGLGLGRPKIDRGIVSEVSKDFALRAFPTAQNQPPTAAEGHAIDDRTRQTESARTVTHTGVVAPRAAGPGKSSLGRLWVARR